MPLVSILIPVYNAENYIVETLEKSLAQQYSNVEIILIDDGSTDKSWDIIEKYKQLYPSKIRAYKQNNLGACSARNKAFELSKGEYVQYLDADDYLSENKIFEQIKLFNQYGNDIITSCSWIRTDVQNIEKKIIDKDYSAPLDWLIDSWSGNGAGQTSIWLTHRSIIEKAGPWNEKLTKNQDGEFFCRVLLNAKSIKYCDQALVYYRHTFTSLSNSLTYASYYSLLQSFELYVTHLESFTDQKHVKKALVNNFVKYYFQLYPQFPDLLDRAEQSIRNLGFNKIPPHGNKNFKLLSALIGVKNALALRHVFSKSRTKLMI